MIMYTNPFSTISHIIFVNTAIQIFLELVQFRHVTWLCSQIASTTRTIFAIPFYEYFTYLTSFISFSIVATSLAFSRFEFFTNIFACQWVLPGNVLMISILQILI